MPDLFKEIKPLRDLRFPLDRGKIPVTDYLIYL